MGLVVAVALAGCGSRVIARERPAWVGAEGGGWQLVLESEHATIAAADHRPETDRLDDGLGRLPVSGVTAMLYPPTDRPSLERSRRLWLEDDPRHPVFFLPPRPRPDRR